jgi:DNA-directed RNA polymerase specialized sigma24 family protein
VVLADLADADLVAVEEACTGQRPVRLQEGEKILAAVTLTRRGLFASQIADRLRVSTRTAQRWQRRARELGVIDK